MRIREAVCILGTQGVTALLTHTCLHRGYSVGLCMLNIYVTCGLCTCCMSGNVPALDCRCVEGTVQSFLQRADRAGVGCVYDACLFVCPKEHEKVAQGLILSVFFSHTCSWPLGTVQHLQDESANEAVNCPQFLQASLS